MRKGYSDKHVRLWLVEKGVERERGRDGGKGDPGKSFRLEANYIVNCSHTVRIVFAPPSHFLIEKRC